LHFVNRPERTKLVNSCPTVRIELLIKTQPPRNRSLAKRTIMPSMKTKHKVVCLAAVILGVMGQVYGQNKPVVLRHVTVIDGTGAAPKKDVDVEILKDVIVAIRPASNTANGSRVDMQGKTIMPLLISTHSHIGTVSGTTTAAENYTRKNILRQLRHYEHYGVGAVLIMGTDRPLLFEGLRDSSAAGRLPGAKLFSAGFGFAVRNAAPEGSGMDKLFRPVSAEEVPKQMEELAKLRPTVVKIWVDDFNGKSEKMKPEIYQAIIREAHQHGLRVASHLYYRDDAEKLVDAGVDIIAHSIRDQEIDDVLIKKMKEKKIVYIPTLSLDEYAFAYAGNPQWINDEFFKASLEPGVYAMITDPAYRDKIKNSPDYGRNKIALEIALRNLKKIYDSGILVSLGTDSGANPLRAQGFSEHLELELLVEAGLTPLQAITVGTKNAATVLGIDKAYGTLEVGKKADFIVLTESPETKIKNTRTIDSVWRNGKPVSQGPL